NSELVQQLAEFHAERGRAKAPLQVASLTPPLPRLLGPPRMAERSPARLTAPSDRDRARLAELAREPPRLLRAPTLVSRRPAPGVPEVSRERGDDRAVAALASLPGNAPTFASAPAYDEDHPEELSYRPFPIAPLLTASASVDAPGLARLVQGDLG